jgi:hypothetical protein
LSLNFKESLKSLNPSIKEAFGLTIDELEIVRETYLQAWEQNDLDREFLPIVGPRDVIPNSYLNVWVTASAAVQFSEPKIEIEMTLVCRIYINNERSPNLKSYAVVSVALPAKTKQSVAEISNSEKIKKLFEDKGFEIAQLIVAIISLLLQVLQYAH